MMKINKYFVVNYAEEDGKLNQITIALDTYEEAKDYMNTEFCKNMYPGAFVMCTLKEGEKNDN